MREAGQKAEQPTLSSVNNFSLASAGEAFDKLLHAVHARVPCYACVPKSTLHKFPFANGFQHLHALADLALCEANVASALMLRSGQQCRSSDGFELRSDMPLQNMQVLVYAVANGLAACHSHALDHHVKRSARHAPCPVDKPVVALAE